MKMHHSNSTGEKGYVLLSIMLLVTLMLIALSIEAPRIAQQIKRAKEEELIHRGNEYKNAIRKYVRKFGQYPVSLDQLEKANNTRFLRKRYKDPFTGKDDWHLLHQGEVQINMATAGTNTPVSGGSGQIGSSIGQPGGLPGSNIGQPSGMMGNSIGMSPGQFGNQPSGQFGGSIGQPASPIGSGIGQSSTFGATPSAGAQPGQAQPGQPGTDPNAPGAASTNGITAASNMPGASNSSPIIGGGPIIGVASTSKLQAIKVIDGKDHYNDWPFWYDPRFDTQTAGVGVGAAGLGANPAGTPASGINPGAAAPGQGTMGQPGITPPRASQ
jgi:type II secretory pathway pseudopilin PulG